MSIEPWTQGEVEWLPDELAKDNRLRHPKGTPQGGEYASKAWAVMAAWPASPTDPGLKQVPFPYDPAEAPQALEEMDEAASRHDAFTRSTRHVPLAELRATQPSLVLDELQRHLTTSSDDRPMVIAWNARTYILDGHHRAAVALARGDTTLRVEFIERRVAKTADETEGDLWDLRDKVLERLRRIAKAYNPQQPRDQNGRWTDFWGDVTPYDFLTPLGDDWWTPDPVTDHVNLYHVTSLDSAKAIHAEGFKPGKEVGPFQGWAPRELGTYGWSSLARALYEVQRPEFNEEGQRDELAIVALSVPKSHWAQLASDEDITQARDDWRASHKDGSVVFRGAVPTEFITNIYVSHQQVEKAADPHWDGFYLDADGTPQDVEVWNEVLGADDWDTWDVAESWLTKWIRKWDSAAHPRHPKGHPQGGRFAPKGGGDVSAIPDHPSVTDLFSSREVLAEFVDSMVSTLGPGWKLTKVEADETDALSGAAYKQTTKKEWGYPRVVVRLEGPEQAGLVREFYRNSKGERVAHHAYFQLPPQYQGKGTAKDLTAFNLLWYPMLGVDKIELQANLDVGGYAWARLGYRSVGRSDIVGNILDRLDNDLMGVPARTKQKLQRILMEDDDFLYKISAARLGDRNLGKELLAGLEWQGELYLNDPRGMAHMESSVAKKGNPYRRPGGSPEGGEYTTGPGDVGAPGTGFTQKHGAWVTAQGRRPTTVQLALLKTLGVPPTYRDVRFNHKPSPGRPKVWATDSKGRVKRFYSKDQHAARAVTKYARVRAFEAAFPKLEAAMERDFHTDDAAACLYLISRTALRPGSDRDTRAAKKAYGATTLEARHVKVNGSSVTLAFTGKNGKLVELPVTDARAKVLLKERAAKGGRLFGTTTDAQLRDYLKAHAGATFKVKDLRTRFATAMAHKLVKELPLPLTKTEFRRMRKDVATKVAAQLGNAASMTLNNYIDPVVFKRIGGDKWN
jgi:DNA topoisomerase I